MRSSDQIEVQPAFPCFYWHQGDYMFSAEEPGHLYVGSSSALHDDLRKGKWHLIDCRGWFFDITGWEQIEPFGGLEFWFDRLIGRVFFVPILSNEHQLTLDAAKHLLLRVAETRFQHEPDAYILSDIQGALPHAKSFLEAIKVVSKGT